MVLFVISFFTGCIGLMIGSALSDDITCAMFGTMLGFSLPYAIIVQEIYSKIKNMRKGYLHDLSCIDNLLENICPACGSKISSEDKKCIFCGIPLIVESEE